VTKLIIQIPCYNEEQSLGTTLDHLPRNLSCVDEVEWLVIDDGSTDRTVEVAKAHGVGYIVSHSRNLGLARTFTDGLEACLAHGADLIVNIDADNQYRAEYIPQLLRPILDRRADLVIGARMVDNMEEYSTVKRVLHRIGCWAVAVASGTGIPDAPSGFRALSREAAMRTRVYSRYTYTLETIIQAGQRGLNIAWVPIETNPVARPSRLIQSIPSYVTNCLVTIVRIFVVYRPFRFFCSIGAVLFLLGTLVGLRFLWLFFTQGGSGHVQSLILASILIGMGFQTIMVAFVADLLSVNRKLAEDNRYHSLQEALGRNNRARAMRDRLHKRQGSHGPPNLEA
jgi:glycosyltransferase involved in cell wall biosynthesis